jgi:hypothetical protein
MLRSIEASAVKCGGRRPQATAFDGTWRLGDIEEVK